jgi:hypothetical protein
VWGGAGVRCADNHPGSPQTQAHAQIAAPLLTTTARGRRPVFQHSRAVMMTSCWHLARYTRSWP